MDWLSRMNDAVRYIEDNLLGEIDYKLAARIACCSVYNFQRLFSFIVDVPLSDYIRHRRLTLAAFELQNSCTKVIDIALKYGYDSPEAFAYTVIPAMTWAVFTSETENVQEMWKRIFSEWFPTSNYELKDGAEFEMYGSAEDGSEYCEIWLPVSKK